MAVLVRLRKSSPHFAIIGGGAVRGSPAKLMIVRVDWCKFQLDGVGVDVSNIASNWLYPKRGV